MTEEPTTEPRAADAPGRIRPEPSTDLVLPARRAAVAPVRRWPDVVVRVRGRLLELRQNPAAMATVSAAATVGSALVTAGVRRALRPGAPAGRTTSVAVTGHVLHEVHVIHHVVHHVIRPPAG